MKDQVIAYETRVEPASIKNKYKVYVMQMFRGAGLTWLRG